MLFNSTYRPVHYSPGQQQVTMLGFYYCQASATIRMGYRSVGRNYDWYTDVKIIQLINN